MVKLSCGEVKWVAQGSTFITGRCKNQTLISWSELHKKQGMRIVLAISMNSVKTTNEILKILMVYNVKSNNGLDFKTLKQKW